MQSRSLTAVMCTQSSKHQFLGIIRQHTTTELSMFSPLPAAVQACLAYAGYRLVVKAPIELHNSLPVPLRVILSSSDPDRSPIPTHVVVMPLQTCMLHQSSAFHYLESVKLEPTGYKASPPMGVPQGPPLRNRYCIMPLCNSATPLPLLSLILVLATQALDMLLAEPEIHCHAQSQHMYEVTSPLSASS